MNETTTNFTNSISPSLFLNWWSIVSWGVAFFLTFFIFTKHWRNLFWETVIFDFIGWLCIMYASFTGNWFIGWFAWVIPLSAAIVMRVMLVSVEER